MKTVYIDYNVIVDIAGIRASPDANRLVDHVGLLRGNKYRFVLSAWHAVELARSNRPEHVRSCVEFIHGLKPLWLSDSFFVKTEEIRRFLQQEGDSTETQPHDAVPAMNEYVSQMWSTYGGPVFVGESFGDFVEALRTTPGALETVIAAAHKTPNAIRSGREAMKDGRVSTYENIVDREYFDALVGPGDGDAVDYILANKDRVLETCTAIAIEEHLTTVRINDAFKPKVSDAADLQHAIVGLAYCDHFVSGDKKLRQHSKVALKKAGVTCGIHRQMSDIPVGE